MKVTVYDWGFEVGTAALARLGLVHGTETELTLEEVGALMDDFDVQLHHVLDTETRETNRQKKARKRAKAPRPIPPTKTLVLYLSVRGRGFKQR